MPAGASKSPTSMSRSFFVIASKPDTQRQMRPDLPTLQAIAEIGIDDAHRTVPTGATADGLKKRATLTETFTVGLVIFSATGIS